MATETLKVRRLPTMEDRDYRETIEAARIAAGLIKGEPISEARTKEVLNGERR